MIQPVQKGKEREVARGKERSDILQNKERNTLTNPCVFLLLIKILYFLMEKLKQHLFLKTLNISQLTLQMEELKVLELFSGIGGMHRAAQFAEKYLPRIKLKAR